MAIAPDRVVAILLAGGRSERFGTDKLAHLFRGRPLAAHAAATLAAIPFARRVAVVGPTELDFSVFGFETIRIPPGAMMSESVRAGGAIADISACDACLVALADMPLVPAAHFRALLHEHGAGITATECGLRTVPAVFPRSAFARLVALHGDKGAKSLLGEARGVAAEPLWLADVDTPSDMQSLQSCDLIPRV